MKKIFKLVGTVMVMLTALASFSAEARCCGTVMGNKIETYGGLSCSQAKKVYKAFNAGHTPEGWTCGQSVGGCGKGKQGFTFRNIRR